jgi:hypothetical protein
MYENSKVTASHVLRVTSLTLLAGLSLSFAPPGKSKHWSADFDTQFQSVVVFPIATISVVGQGHAQHMGNSTAVTNNQMVNFISGQGTATYELTAANGDTVVLELDAATTFLPSGVTFAGTYVVTGGTGRFAGAGGVGSVLGSATFTGPTNGFGTFAVDGTLTTP